jgi:two-component system, chemotaxis family, sensor kinase CheA
MNALFRFIRLPRELSAFEENYLSRMNKVAMGFFLAHLPIFIIISAVNGTGPLLTAILTLGVLSGPYVAMKTCAKRVTSMIMGMTAMFMGSILVHIGQGPVQIEMHFYFFVLIALLAVFANPMVILVAAVTAAVHHASLWLLLPESVFNYDAPVWVVAVHATFVVLESVAACYIARSFFDNVIELEKIVQERTREVAARNRDMRMLLDAVDQGFFTINPQGIMSDERSSAVDRWLGTPAPGITLPDYLRQYDSKIADWLAMGLDDVFAELMPVEVTIDQLPCRLIVGEKTFKIEYSPVNREGQLVALAVVISDISAQVARERLEAEHRMMMAMVEKISQDKAGFLEFVQEAEEIVTGLDLARTGDINDLKRKVHTLKGNAAIFGLELVANACHTLEDHIAEYGTLPDDALWDLLATRWQSVRENLQRLVGEDVSGINLKDEEYVAILNGILTEEPRANLACRVAAWRLEPTEIRMMRIGEQAKTLAKRYGKGDIQVVTKGGDLRIDPEHWAFFWSSFIHVVRNAIDHGLETPEERLATAKSEFGTIEMSTEVMRDRFIVSISDDGRGINWDRIAEMARAKNLPSDTHQNRVDALFVDGLSTAETVTEISGRGVGMAAVKDACLALGGRIEIDSKMGVGTTIRIFFPVDEMAPATISFLNGHGVIKPERASLGTQNRYRSGDSVRLNDVQGSAAL